MNERIRLFLTAKQIERVRRGKVVNVNRAGIIYEIGKKKTSDREFKIKARIASWRAKLKEIRANGDQDK